VCYACGLNSPYFDRGSPSPGTLLMPRIPHRMTHGFLLAGAHGQFQSIVIIGARVNNTVREEVASQSIGETI
jgi:hypothetical protein